MDWLLKKLLVCRQKRYQFGIIYLSINQSVTKRQQYHEQCRPHLNSKSPKDIRTQNIFLLWHGLLVSKPFFNPSKLSHGRHLSWFWDIISCFLALRNFISRNKYRSIAVTGSNLSASVIIFVNYEILMICLLLMEVNDSKVRFDFYAKKIFNDAHKVGSLDKIWFQENLRCTNMFLSTKMTG